MSSFGLSRGWRRFALFSGKRFEAGGLRGGAEEVLVVGLGAGWARWRGFDSGCGFVIVGSSR